MNKLTIDPARCVGCMTCYRACFVDVFRWDAENRRPIAAYEEDCVNCCFCVAECPVSAISLETDYSRDWEAIPGDSQPVTVEVDKIPFRKERQI